jgi:ammonium transporter, Amt family
MAMAMTQIAAATGALSWMCTEWAWRGKPSAIGIASGSIAGLVGITPAAGFVSALRAFFIGITCGLVCFLASTKLKQALGYDDTLDVFGIHGVAGIIGALLTGVFAPKILGGTQAISSIANQVWLQFIGVASAIAYTAILY